MIQTWRSIPRVMTILAGCVLLVMAGGCSSEKTIQLTKQIDIENSAVESAWRLQHGMLENTASTNARITMPVIPYGDYLLQMRLTRVIGSGSVNVIIPVGNRQAVLVIGRYENGLSMSGLELVNGMRMSDNSARNDMFDVVNHRSYDLAITVRTRDDQALVSANIDDRPFIRWRGVVPDLSVPIDWDLGDDRAIGLGAEDSIVQFQRVRLRMLPGETSELLCVE